MFKKKKKLVSELETAKPKLEEKEYDRQPNHWSFDDDPVLNLDPVFSDELGENEDPLKTVAIEKPQSTEDDDIKKAKLKKIKEAKSSIYTAPTNELTSLINAARKSSDDIQKTLIENDPVIARLHKIEQLTKSGGTDETLYTDLSKSTSQSVYAQRAQEIQSKNGIKPIESELERARRLSAEAEEKRRLLRESEGLGSSEPAFAYRSRRTTGLRPADKTIDLNEIPKEMLEKLENIVTQRQLIIEKNKLIKELTKKSNLLLRGDSLKTNIEKQEKNLIKTNELLDKTIEDLEKTFIKASKAAQSKSKQKKPRKAKTTE